MLDLIKYTKLIKNFINWYKKKEYSISISNFLNLKFEFQIGVILEYLSEQHDIGIHWDNYSYLLYSLGENRSIKLLSKDGYLQRISLEDKVDLKVNCKDAIDWIFNKLNENLE
jgi:hypothetical protein